MTQPFPPRRTRVARLFAATVVATLVAAPIASADVVDDEQAFLTTQMSATQSFINGEQAFVNTQVGASQQLIEDEQRFLNQELAATQTFIEGEQAFLRSSGCTGTCFNLQPFIDDEQAFLTQQQAALNRFIDDEQAFLGTENAQLNAFVDAEQTFLNQQHANLNTFIDDEQAFLGTEMTFDDTAEGYLVANDDGTDDYETGTGSADQLGVSTAGDMSLAGSSLNSRSALTFLSDRAGTGTPAGGACTSSAAPKGFTAGKPQVTYHEGEGVNGKVAFQMHWLHQAFKQSHSHKYGLTQYKSYTMCMKGGAKGLNGHNLRKALAGVTLDDSSAIFSGYNGDRDITDQKATASIGVTAPAGPFTLSGTINVAPKDVAGFAPGRDGNTPASFPDSQVKNLINIYWTGKNADAFEGNAGFGQWEVPQSKAFPGWRTYYFTRVSSRMCLGC